MERLSWIIQVALKVITDVIIRGSREGFDADTEEKAI